jgi:hypothetical protein
LYKLVGLELESFRPLPFEGLDGAKVAVLGSLQGDRQCEVELLDAETKAHVKAVAVDLDELIRGL